MLVFVGLVWYAGKSNTEGIVSADILTRSDSQKILVPNAKVTLVEFADFQCPACRAIHPLVQQILKDYQGKITFVFRNFPLPQHRYAVISAEAAEIAGDQGKFWEMHDAIFEHQDEWANSKSPKNLFIQYAKNLDLNVDEFTKSLNDNKYTDKIGRDKSDGNLANVDSTPTFFVNGQKLILQSAGDLKNAIDNALK